MLNAISISGARWRAKSSPGWREDDDARFASDAEWRPRSERSGVCAEEVSYQRRKLKPTLKGDKLLKALTGTGGGKGALHGAESADTPSARAAQAAELVG